MTQNVFQLWLLVFDRRMQGCQVLLSLDNCPGHIPLEKFVEMNVVLCNTRVFYLPPNMTSAVQPCDVGIIHTFKAYYRKRFNNLLLDGYENNIDNLEKISIMDAFCLAVPTWVEDVSPAIIANCFCHCKIRTSNIIHTQQGEVGPPTALIQELQHQQGLYVYCTPFHAPSTASSYVLPHRNQAKAFRSWIQLMSHKYLSLLYDIPLKRKYLVCTLVPISQLVKSFSMKTSRILSFTLFTFNIVWRKPRGGGILTSWLIGPLVVDLPPTSCTSLARQVGCMCVDPGTVPNSSSVVHAWSAHVVAS